MITDYRINRIYKLEDIILKKDDLNTFIKKYTFNTPELYDEIKSKLMENINRNKLHEFNNLNLKSEKNNNKEFVNEAFSGHMANINRLVKEEKLIVAGPFGKNNDQFRGLFILNNVKTEEEAKEILETDPTIKSGLLSYTIYSWYGSAALPMYLPYSEKVTKSKF